MLAMPVTRNVAIAVDNECSDSEIHQFMFKTYLMIKLFYLRSEGLDFSAVGLIS
jgi:hypothetical protein